MFVLWDVSKQDTIPDLLCPLARCRYSCGPSRKVSGLLEPGSEIEFEKLVVNALCDCLLNMCLVKEAASSGGSNGCCGMLSRSLLPFTVGGRRGVLGSLPS